MRILLTHGYYLSDDPKEQKIMKPYPPLGLLYISGYLLSKGIENDVFDSTFFTQKQQLDFIASKQPEIIAIYTNLMTKIEVVKLIKILKSGNSRFKVILGGPDVSFNIENYLNAGADFLVIGEGEETTYELYRAITGRSDATAVSGIAFYHDGKITRTADRIKFRELDDLPLPNRDAIPNHLYLETWKKTMAKAR